MLRGHAKYARLDPGGMRELVDAFIVTSEHGAFRDLLIKFDLGNPERGSRPHDRGKTDNIIQSMLRAVGPDIAKSLGALVLPLSDTQDTSASDKPVPTA